MRFRVGTNINVTSIRSWSYTRFNRIQCDLDGWMNLTDPNDDTKAYNASGLVRVSYAVQSLSLQMKYVLKGGGTDLQSWRDLGWLPHALG